MPTLKLAKLPDRRNIKITITVSPDLDKALKSYAEIYREFYGDKEEANTLIPYMLEKFLASDKAFARNVKPRVNGDGERVVQQKRTSLVDRDQT